MQEDETPHSRTRNSPSNCVCDCGRDRRFRRPPAQIPACGTTAPGSSEILTSARLPPSAFCYSLHLCLPCFPGPTCPVKVSSVGYVSLSVPSPRERPYRLRVLRTDPTPEGLRLPYLSFRVCLPAFQQELFGSPMFPASLSTHATL